MVAGVAVIVTQGLPLGIDFSGGTQLIVTVRAGRDRGQVRVAVSAAAGRRGGAAVRRSRAAPDHDPAAAGRGERAGHRASSRSSQQVEQALQKAGLPKFTDRSARHRRPVDRRRSAAARASTPRCLSLLGITIYIGFRFRFSFAVGAIAATFHDVLVTLAFLVFFKYELSLNVVAAILTITGYSVNDTIVIFDRVRENLRSMRREPLEQVVNISVNQTLAAPSSPRAPRSCRCWRCILFGGEALEGFAFTMLVGIISGTYSTVFIASAIAIILSQQRGARRPARQPAPPASRAEPRASRSRKKRGARLLTRDPVSSPRCWESSRGSPSSCRSPPRRICCSARDLLGFDDPGGAFTVMIQLGSILAVMWLYRAKIISVVARAAVRPGRAAVRARWSWWRSCRRSWPARCSPTT